MNGISIKYTLKTDSKLNSIQLYIKIVALSRGLKMADNDVAILAYFMEYGLNQATRDKIIQAGLLKDETCLRNSISRLRKNGWIVKNMQSPFGEKLCKELNVKLGDINIIKLFLDNR